MRRTRILKQSSLFDVIVSLSLIVAMDRNRLIGNNNQLPWHMPADLAHFKQVTMGKPIVMGRKTYESIGRPLPGRKNIVLSRAGYSADGVEVVSSICEAVATVADAKEVMIIGGATIYASVLDVVDRIYLTIIDDEFSGDAWFPEFDKELWTVISEEQFSADDKNRYAYRFITYERKDG